MTSERFITLQIPEALYCAALRTACKESLTPAELVRDALAQRVANQGRLDRAVENMRTSLSHEFETASDWLDLQRRLRAQDCVIRRHTGELWLCSWPWERRLVRLERLGSPEAELALRFHARFPAHGTEPVKAGHRIARPGFLRWRRKLA